jgi:hypothetical protein
MNTSNYRFTLDLHSTQSQISIPAIVGDRSRKLCIALSDGGKPYYIEDGCLAKISIKRPTGTHLVEFCNIERNTVIVYDFAQNTNTVAVEGIHECDVTLYGADDGVLGSPRFTIIASERVVRRDDIDMSDDDYTAVEAMIASEVSRVNAEALRENAEALRKNVEISRVDAEALRENAEALRKNAEISRVDAEAKREASVKDALQKLDNAVKVTLGDDGNGNVTIKSGNANMAIKLTDRGDGNIILEVI